VGSTPTWPTILVQELSLFIYNEHGEVVIGTTTRLEAVGR
jgi:hypothetical protein